MLGALQLSHGSNLYSKSSYLCDSFVSVPLAWCVSFTFTPKFELEHVWLKEGFWTRGSECLLVVVLSLRFSVRDH